ncbi:glycosyltransferase family 4 protein [Planctobacterium marinum]|uniref:Glycosyltransferase WbuB n=1 Tax=Planctobacterium marinum TaxID=1631968 RepID=A0AA48KSZ2_9ALTE|nr:glycosyltransferase WbuB [Planctobacterium marinum]
MTGKGNLLVIHRYFWPQNYPYAVMLKDIVEQVADNFEQVSIASSVHHCSELEARKKWAVEHGYSLKTLKMRSEKGMNVAGKVFIMLRYCIWLCWVLSRTRADVVMVATTPPILTAFVVRFMSKIRGYDYIYHCQDIHPEASKKSLLAKVPVLFKWLSSIDKANVCDAKEVITLSEDMKRTLVQRGASPNNIHLINNFIFKQLEQGFGLQTETTDNIIRLVFAGSLGRLQNLPFLFELIKKYRNSEIVEFHILGDGVLKSQLEADIQGNSQTNVKFYGQVPLEEALLTMARCDIGIVPLSEGIIRVAYPSKTMMYLSTGLAVLALVEQDSELVNYLEQNELGVAVSNTCQQQAYEKFNAFLTSFTKDPAMRMAIKTQAEHDFGKRAILSKFKKVVK